MARRACIRWSAQEVNVLKAHFPLEGAAGCMARMKKIALRGELAVKVKAHSLGIKGPRRHHSLMRALTDQQVEEVIRLHDVEKIGFKPIGERFGVAETTASNAYFKAMCPRLGYRPAERDANGHLLPAEIERLRTFLLKGTKPVDIQLFMGISAGCIAEERRQYNAELRTRGKRPLPPPGNGERYSGARIPKETVREVERLYLEGKATPEVADLTGVSKTHSLRTRAKLVRRLKRKGECLPGCDIDGKRLSYPTSLVLTPAHKPQQLRALLLEGWPVSRAANKVGMGKSQAYKVRDDLKSDLEAEGKQLPPTINWRTHPPETTELAWVAPQKCCYVYYRRLEDEHGDQEARRLIRIAARAVADLPLTVGRLMRLARRERSPTFEEQLERVRNGAGLSTRIDYRRPAPEMTLGGIASAQI